MYKVSELLRVKTVPKGLERGEHLSLFFIKIVQGLKVARLHDLFADNEKEDLAQISTTPYLVNVRLLFGEAELHHLIFYLHQ